MSRKAISFRLRAMDSDLAEAIDGIESEVLSDLARNGLRLMLGIRTTKQMEVREKPLVIPDTKEKTARIAVHAKSAIYRPNIR